MWVRNIVWFILLIGIVMFSLLLFLLVMNPTSDYQTTEQTVSKEKATDGEKEHSPKAEAVEQPASASEEKHVSPAANSHEAGATPAASSSAKQETAHGEPKQESPPTVRADGDSPVSPGYLFGIGSGYFALLCTLVPYGLFMFSGRLQRSRLQAALPFFMLLSITVVALHGGIMLRVIQEWDRHLLAGVGAFACLLIFYMRVSLYTPGVYRRNNPFVVLVVAILLFVIIHAIG